MTNSRGIRAALACAALAVTLAFAWQALEVRYNYGANWTGLFSFGERWPAPPSVTGRELYRFKGQGYDAQFYYYIAHDPLIRGDVKQYVDNPVLRWRRILAPAAARFLALGRADRILPTYILVVLASLFAGVFWLGRFFQQRDYSPWWGLAFLAVPAVAVSLDRMTVDIVLAALCVGFALLCTTVRQTERLRIATAAGNGAPLEIRNPQSAIRNSPVGRASDEAALYALLVLAPLARETGLALVAGIALFELVKKRFARAALAACCTLPWLAWAVFVRSRLWADATPWTFPVPFAGLVLRTLRPVQYAVTGHWLALAAALDYLAVLGIWLALFFTARLAWKKQFGSLELACMVFAAGIAFISKADVWGDAYAFGRTMSPLLLWLALIGLDGRAGGPASSGKRPDRFAFSAALVLPLALTVPRIALQIATVSVPIARGLLHGFRAS